LVTQQLGLAEVGFYAAAFALSGVFVNFVLTAMGADYYPRLTAAADDPAQMERLINEQTEIGILLAAPGLLLIMALAPMILLVFYTKEFLPAADLLQWFLIGCMGRVISWPLGFVLIAQGRGRLFAITESLAQVLHMILIWLGLLWLGLQGTALAFALLYVLYTVMIRVVVGRLIHFSWSGSVIGLTTLCLAASAVIFLFGELPDSNVGIALGSITALVMGVLCSRALFRRLGSEHRLARIAASVPGGRCLFGLQPG
jgi:PST family polysaccharide transporter